MKALVTGGGGFLGSAIVRLLLERGDEVRVLARGDYPALRELGAETLRGDVALLPVVEEAVDGMDVVFHAAAKAGIWGAYKEFHAANVTGTRNILRACREKGVKRLVHTSSPSVVFDGRDMEGVDETVPYPREHKSAYAETKAAAEREVLAANDAALATVALRPHLIWGPGDNHIVPRIVERARSGALRRIGREDKRVDSTYIDNAALAHLLAADRLAPGSPVAGRAYFISNGEPLPVWELVGRILEAAGAPPVTRSISPRAAYAAGVLLEGLYTLLNLPGEPRMTRFLAEELSTAHWFDLGAARRDLGYAPAVSVEEGLRRLKASLS